MIAASGKLHLMFARIIRHIKHLNLNTEHSNDENESIKKFFLMIDWFNNGQ